MDHYPLQRFYEEAKAILEKYPTLQKENYILHVSFDIKNNRLDCSVWYRSVDYKGNEYYGHAVRPANALAEFEDECRQATGEIITEELSVEV